jgi:hypothetical protein
MDVIVSMDLIISYSQTAEWRFLLRLSLLFWLPRVL